MFPNCTLLIGLRLGECRFFNVFPAVNAPPAPEPRTLPLDFRDRYYKHTKRPCEKSARRRRPARPSRATFAGGVFAILLAPELRQRREAKELSDRSFCDWVARDSALPKRFHRQINTGLHAELVIAVNFGRRAKESSPISRQRRTCSAGPRVSLSFGGGGK